MNDGVFAALAALPWWVGLAPTLFASVVTFIATFVALEISLRIASGPLRRTSDSSWTEVARLAWPVRRGTSIAILTCPLAALALAVALFSGPTASLSPLLHGAVVWGSSLAVALWYRARVRRVLGRTIGAREGMVSGVTTLLTFYPWLPVVLAMLVGTTDSFGLQTLVTLGIGGVAMLASGLGLGVLIARGLGLARPAPSELNAIVTELAAEVGAKVRGLVELPMQMANAFAFPAIGLVAITSPARAALNSEEFRAVMAHELGHLREGPWAIVTRMLVPVLLFVLSLARPIIGTWGATTFVPVVGAVIVVLVLFKRILRRLEDRADHAAHEADVSEVAYGSALEALYRLNGVPAVVGGRRIHADLYDRLLEAGVAPSYPRPAPPSSRRTRAAFLVAIVVLCCTLGVSRIALSMLGGVPGWELPVAACTGGDRWELKQAAYAAVGSGDTAEAIALYELCRTGYGDSYCAASLAVIYGDRGECDRAHGYLTEATDSLAEGSDSHALDSARDACARCEAVGAGPL